MTETEAMERLLRIGRKSVVRKINGHWWVFTRSFGMPRVLGYEDHAEAIANAHVLARYS